MSTARAEFVKQTFNAGSNHKPNLLHLNAQTHGHVVARLDFAAFNASTAPEGIQGLGSSDTIELAVVSPLDGTRRDKTTGKIILRSVRLSPDAAMTLGAANNITLRVVRGSSSVLSNIIVATITEASLTANALVGANDINIWLEEGDKIVLVPDGTMDGTAVAGTDLFVDISYMRATPGGRLEEGTAA
jgi:hypothetical protein